MAEEIERKFLVSGDGWRGQANRILYRQGYLATAIDSTVRVRVAGDKGYLTIKSSRSGISRLEFEYEIPLDEANLLLDLLCQKPLIEKWRCRIPYRGLIWEVDEFLADNAGLVIAEVELDHPDQPIDLPRWVGQEVSQDPRYYNSNLVKYPYSLWQNG